MKTDTIVFFIIPATERDEVGTILMRHSNSYVLRGFQYSPKDFLICDFFVPSPHVVDHNLRASVVLSLSYPRAHLIHMAAITPNPTITETRNTARFCQKS